MTKNEIEEVFIINQIQMGHASDFEELGLVGSQSHSLLGECLCLQKSVISVLREWITDNDPRSIAPLDPPIDS